MSAHFSSAKKKLFACVDLVLPPRCPVSGDAVEAQGMVSPAIWKETSFIAEPFCACCGVPFAVALPDNVENKALLCSECLADPPPFRMARAALRYDGAGRDLVLAFKHGDKTHSALSFTPWLLRAGAPFLEDADALVPVPLHRWRLLRRRYNQACIMVKYVSAQTGLKVLPDGLQRLRATVSQGKMNARQRDENVRSAFSVPERHRNNIYGKKIVLVDDVYTTGATVRACAKTLLKAGAERVDVLTLARVAREG